ncbi:MAG: S-layer homology domain-containing protein [Oscillibacter sp.]|nr:S-layer homology domain-containing protein [Oscillibacter sp.]MBD5153616.1 S-layer homology domain-containing protein [Oscillibacter sp.]
MRKRLLIFALTALLCLGLVPTATAAEESYSDVPAGHWAAESIDRATELGLFQGVGDGKFGLGQPISRAAFATAMTRLFGWEEVKPDKPSYTDAAKSSWYYAAVETVLANGAVDASGHEFRPADNLTRGEMASMLVRGLGYTSLAGTAANYGAPFSDVTANVGYITLANDLGIMDGKGSGRFDPDGNATREQAAAVLVRVHDMLERTTTKLSSSKGYQLINIATPTAKSGDEMPVTPLEPLPELYATLRRMKNNGEDMSKAALHLMAGGVRTITDAGGNPIAASSLISAKEVQEVLARKDAKPFYSTQYESAYCMYDPNAYQSATVWYQSDESMAAKLQLAKLFGVTHYVME